MRKPEHLEGPAVVGWVGRAVVHDPKDRVAINFQETWSLTVRVGTEGRTGTPKGLARDLLDHLLAKDVRAVFLEADADQAQAILAHIDWAVVSSHPKIVVMPTAAAALAMAIRKETGLVSFFGPLPSRSLAERPRIRAFTRRALERTLFRTRPPGLILPSHRLTEDPVPRRGRRRWRLNPGSVWVRRGSAEGPFLGGSLPALEALWGTPLWPDLSGALLYLDPGPSPTAARDMDTFLGRLDKGGVFRLISGLVVGRGAHQSFEDHARIHQLLKDHTATTEVPVLADIDLGPSDPVLTLPVGVRARLSQKGLTFTESGVT